VPAGSGYCNTPYTITFKDATPEPTTSADNYCGWKIKRTWTIATKLHQCIAVPPSGPYSTDRVQTLFVRDDTAPYAEHLRALL